MDRRVPPVPVGVRGRQQEWQAVLDMLGRARHDGGGSMLIEGEAGMGKTLLLVEAARKAEADGFSVAIGVGHELSRLMPLAPIFSALGESGRTLTSQAGGNGVLNAGIWIDALRARLEERAGAGPALIALDDLQWADPATLLALRTLLPELAAFRLAWLLARRTPDPGSGTGVLFDLLEREGSARLRLGSLDDDAVTGLITDVLGAIPEPRLVKLAAGAAGNPSMIVELISGLVDEDAVVISGGRADLASARVPGRTRAMVRSRIKGLSSRARQLLEVVAILGESFDLEDAAIMLGEPPAALLAPLQECLAARVLVTTQDTIAFRQELVRQAIVESLPPPIRQALHRQVGEMLLARGDWSAAEAAVHFLHGARRGDAAALAGLERAATEVLDSSPQTAVQLATRALELTRPSDPKRVARAVTVAEALTASGRLDEASLLVDEALAESLPGLTRARLRCVLSCLFCLNAQHARGRTEAEKVLVEPRLPGSVRDNARIALLRAALGLRDNEQAAALARKILTRPHGGQSRAVVAAMIARALILWDGGQVAEALQLSRKAAHKDGWSVPDARSFQPHLFLAARLVDVHSFDEAARLIRTASGHLDAFPYLESPAIFSAMLARMHLANGRPEAAAAELHGGRSIASWPTDMTQSATASAILGTLALRRGELKTAASYLDGRPAHSPLPEAAYEHTWHALVSAQIQEARAGSQSAVSMLMPIYATLRDHRFLLIYDPTSASWLVRFALAIGDPSRAKLAASVADEVARANPSFPVLTAAAAHAKGIAEEDLGLLSFAADRHGDSWGRASAAEDAGVLLAARVEHKLAVARLDQALTEYHGCGAARDAARVRRRLRMLGIRRRHWTSARRPLTGWVSLTETEQAICQLAAQGLTNQQIAHQMYLSVHTVAFHLRHVFRKLEINSRVELAALVIGQARTSGETQQQARRPAWPGSPSRLRSTDRPLP